jgi:signal peptidase II
MQKNSYARGLGAFQLFGYSALAFLLDAATKALFFDHADLFSREGSSFLRPVIGLTVHANTGATGNIAIPLFALITFSVGFLTWGVWMFFQLERWWARRVLIFFTGLFIGGALGNLADRLTLGYVRDWILVLETSVLNVADIAILLGCLGIFLLLRPRRPRPSIEAAS